MTVVEVGEAESDAVSVTIVVAEDVASGPRVTVRVVVATWTLVVVTVVDVVNVAGLEAVLEGPTVTKTVKTSFDSRLLAMVLSVPESVEVTVNVDVESELVEGVLGDAH